jgi:hypothetical protein
LARIRQRQDPLQGIIAAIASMAKSQNQHRKKKQTELRNSDSGGESTEPATLVQSGFNASSKASVFDSRTVRWLVSAGLIFYLAILFLGPLSNPVSSDFLTRPLAEMASPVHRALFLGHGYRFFGPDPGPGHSVVYRITDQQGEFKERRFPDRDEIWPRLMYHRWFMLSESIYNEHAMTPDEKSFRETDAELSEQVDALRKNGKFALSERIARERSKMADQYRDTRLRIDELVSSLAQHLMQVHDGKHIELFVQERGLPFTVQVLTGTNIDDPQFLSKLTKIGEFRRDEQGRAVSVEIPSRLPEGQ